jgi:hypothetical protein
MLSGATYFSLVQAGSNIGSTPLSGGMRLRFEIASPFRVMLSQKYDTCHNCDIRHIESHNYDTCHNSCRTSLSQEAE